VNNDGFRLQNDLQKDREIEKLREAVKLGQQQSRLVRLVQLAAPVSQPFDAFP